VAVCVVCVVSETGYRVKSMCSACGSGPVCAAVLAGVNESHRHGERSGWNNDNDHRMVTGEE